MLPRTGAEVVARKGMTGMTAVNSVGEYGRLTKRPASGVFLLSERKEKVDWGPYCMDSSPLLLFFRRWTMDVGRLTVTHEMLCLAKLTNS